MASGFSNNNILQIDVVYTKLGRRYLAEGQTELARPSKLAFSDDGVDYNLFNPNVAESLQGLAIERIPLLEAMTDGYAVMKNKLINLPLDTVDFLTNMSVSPESTIITSYGDNREPIVKRTFNVSTTIPFPSGFTVTLDDTKYLYLDKKPVSPFSSNNNNGYYYQRPRITQNINTPNKNRQSIQLIPTNQNTRTYTFNLFYDINYAFFRNTTDYNTSIRIESIDFGLVKTIPITLTFNTGR